MFRIQNKCNAPQSFIDAINAAYPKIEVYAKNVFGIDRPFCFFDVVIIDKDDEPPKINEKNSFSNLEIQFSTLWGKIEELQFLVREEPDWERLAEDLMRESREVYHTEMNDSRTEGDNQNKALSKKERIKKINDLMNQLRKLIATAEEKGDKKLGNLIDEIIDIWKKASNMLIYIEYPIVRLGYYTLEREEIFLCYQSIRDSIGAKLTDEYGAFVFAHECFHALHYGHVRENIGIRKWDSSSVPAHIRRRAVVESLAEYFSLEYAARMLPKEVCSQAWKAALAHPFPNWGYAGAEFYSYICPYETSEWNSLFNAVYYASIIDMEIAYRLIDSSQSESSDYDDRYSISTRRLFSIESSHLHNGLSHRLGM